MKQCKFKEGKGNMIKCKNAFADEIKRGIKLKNFEQELRSPSRCYNEAMDRAHKNWELYEQVNRDYCPNDPVYSIIRAGAALSTSADFLGCQAASAGQVRILEIIIGGEATSSAVNRVYINRAGTSFTGGNAVTPELFNSRSPAAAGTYRNSSTQALVGNPMVVLAFNAFGGFLRWVAAPGEELYLVNSEVISIRSNSGTSTCSGTVIVEEL